MVFFHQKAIKSTLLKDSERIPIFLSNENGGKSQSQHRQNL